MCLCVLVGRRNKKKAARKAGAAEMTDVVGDDDEQRDSEPTDRVDNDVNLDENDTGESLIYVTFYSM